MDHLPYPRPDFLIARERHRNVDYPTSRQVAPKPTWLFAVESMVSHDGGNKALSESAATGSRGDAVQSSVLLPLVYEHLRQLAAIRVAQEPPGQTLQPTALVHEAYLRIAKNASAHGACGESARCCDGRLDVGSNDAARGGKSDYESPREDLGWASKDHFFAAAAVAMRRILIERARAKHGPKRGGDRVRVPVDESIEPEQIDADVIDWLAIDEALSALEKKDPELGRLVQLRCFAGLSAEETARVMGISERTVNRDWKIARAAMLRYLEGETNG
jgi:ECF sigma factor